MEKPQRRRKVWSFGAGMTWGVSLVCFCMVVAWLCILAPLWLVVQMWLWVKGGMK